MRRNAVDLGARVARRVEPAHDTADAVPDDEIHRDVVLLERAQDSDLCKAPRATPAQDEADLRTARDHALMDCDPTKKSCGICGRFDGLRLRDNREGETRQAQPEDESRSQPYPGVSQTIVQKKILFDKVEISAWKIKDSARRSKRVRSTSRAAPCRGLFRIAWHES